MEEPRSNLVSEVGPGPEYGCCIRLPHACAASGGWSQPVHSETRERLTLRDAIQKCSTPSPGSHQIISSELCPAQVRTGSRYYSRRSERVA